MNWEALGAIAELFGAIAVFATLAYLAVQVKQSTKTTRAATNHSITRSRNEINVALATEPELSDMLIKGNADYSVLTPQERMRFNAYMYAVLNVYEDLYYQHEQGLADPGQYEGMMEFLQFLFSNINLQEWWRKRGVNMSPEFHAEVDRLIERLESEAGN